MLFVVALAAVGIAALTSCSPNWLTAVISLSAALLLVGMTLACNSTGPARAFWSSFVLWGVLYLAVVHMLWDPEQRSVSGGLVTTQLLRMFYLAIVTEVPFTPAPGWPGPTTMYLPDFDTLLKIGHLVWAWLLALIGGVIGRATFIRFHRASLPPTETRD